MKISVLLIGLLPHALAASFYDEFRGAMSNVERGFGKLITDVVTDVKDTIHCTLSAVEQVLVLKGVLDKTSAYNFRCRDIAKQKNAPLYRNPFDRFKNLNIPSRSEFSSRKISLELESSIINTNKTINDILKRPMDIDTSNPSKVLQAETHHLVEISDMLKNELQKLSSNVQTEPRNSYFDHRSSSVESLWSEIKTLHDIQRSSTNNAEIKEVRQVLDKVVKKLDLPPKHDNVGIYNIDDVKQQLQRLSDRNLNNELHGDDRFKQNLKVHDSQYKGQITKSIPASFKEAAQQIVKRNKEVERKIPDNSPHSEKSVFDLDSDDFANFSPISNANSNQKDVFDNAKKIIQDSKHTDQVLNQFFENHKAGDDVFSNSNLFSF